MNIRARIFGGEWIEESLFRSKDPKGAKADALDSVAVTRDFRCRCDSRGEDRHRLLDERARLTFNDRTDEVELINLSGGGAMIRASIDVMLWDRVHLHLGEHGDVECAVRWIRNDRIGLEFAHETRLDCAGDQLAELLREVISRSFPDVQFGVATEEDEPVEDRFDWDDHRSAPRHPLVWVGTLYHDFEMIPARVRNISATGAMVECPAPIRVGAQPLLQLSETVSVSTGVRWAVGDQVGLAFDKPFDMGLLARARPLEIPNLRPRSYLERAADAGELGIDHWNYLELSELRAELEGFMKR